MSTPQFRVERPEATFPTFSPDQIARIARYGTRRTVHRGELLFDQGTENPSFYVVLSGALQIVRPDEGKEDLIVVHRPGQFAGEVSLLTGRRSLARGRVVEDGEVLELSADRLRALVQTDSELSELLMRAFILPRFALLTEGLGDVAMIGSQFSPSTLRLREFLTRNGH